MREFPNFTQELRKKLMLSFARQFRAIHFAILVLSIPSKMPQAPLPYEPPKHDTAAGTRSAMGVMDPLLEQLRGRKKGGGGVTIHLHSEALSFPSARHLLL